MKKTKLALAIASVALASSQAHATNGMNMDGYGPIATAMGGTASAYDNGLAGMMSNPATIMMDSGDGSTFQIALGNLRPNVTSTMPTMPDAKSAADSFFMPGMGYATKDGKLTWGVGMMAQGGMGTQFEGTSFLAAGTGEEVMSQVGVGRLGLPVNYAVNDKLTIGGSVDFVWAGMDIKMAVAGNYLRSNTAATNPGLVSSATGGLQNFVYNGMDNGTVGAGGVVTLPAGFGSFPVTSGRFDFADGSDYTGEAKGTGLGGKLGFTYKVDSNTTFGASYHTKTNISDLTTSNANLSMTVDGTTHKMTGDIAVKDFQWPATIAFGLSTQVNDKWKVNADFKRIGWQEVMSAFNMDFTVTDPSTASGFGISAGDQLSVAMPQNWEDQNVIMIGTEYQYSEKLALRAGANLSNNPIPETTLNALFPAIIEKHYTAGFGYNMSENTAVDFSLTYAPEVVATNSMTNIGSKHSQISWQAMYTRNW